MEQADPQTSKFIGKEITMDKEKEANSNQESSNNKSQAVVEWLLGKCFYNSQITLQRCILLILINCHWVDIKLT